MPLEIPFLPKDDLGRDIPYKKFFLEKRSEIYSFSGFFSSKIQPKVFCFLISSTYIVYFLPFSPAPLSPVCVKKIVCSYLNMPRCFLPLSLYAHIPLLFFNRSNSYALTHILIAHLVMGSS